MNSKKCLIAVFVGALVAFVWLSFSWMVLLNLHGLKPLKAQTELSAALKAAAPSDGAYVLPAWKDENGKDIDQEVMKKAMDDGPFAFMIILPDGKKFDMIGPMITGFFISVLSALILCFLMVMVSGGGGSDFKRRVITAICFGLATGLLPALADWNWWSFPIGFTIAGAADGLISWTLAGLVMAKILEPKEQLIA